MSPRSGHPAKTPRPTSRTDRSAPRSGVVRRSPRYRVRRPRNRPRPHCVDRGRTNIVRRPGRSFVLRRASARSRHPGARACDRRPACVRFFHRRTGRRRSRSCAIVPSRTARLRRAGADLRASVLRLRTARLRTRRPRPTTPTARSTSISAQRILRWPKESGDVIPDAPSYRARNRRPKNRCCNPNRAVLTFACGAPVILLCLASS